MLERTVNIIPRAKISPIDFHLNRKLNSIPDCAVNPPNKGDNHVLKRLNITNPPINAPAIDEIIPLKIASVRIWNVITFLGVPLLLRSKNSSNLFLIFIFVENAPIIRAKIIMGTLII